MGHLGQLKEEYRALTQRLEANTVSFPEPASPEAWRGWREILEILYTPEEASLAARMPVLPASLEQIAARLETTTAELLPRLERLCDKGLVLDIVHPETGVVRYVLAPPVIGFFEFSMMRADDGIPKRRMAEALEAYCHGDDTFAREVFGAETVLGRTLVHEAALAAQTPQVLDWERASFLISSARSLAVSLCYCRHKAQHLGKACAAPMDNCLSLNAGADFVIHRRFGRDVTRSEALESLAQAREAQLVQVADNVQHKPVYICNCCGCCCEQLRAVQDYDLVAVNPSGFTPRLDTGACSGCARCERACPIKAIEMAPAPTRPDGKARKQPAIDLERCIGCGLCSQACQNSALAMSRASAPSVPLNTVEKTLRMVLERNRLAHFVDANAGRGSYFLNGVLKALTHLKPVEKALASRQLRSRFVRFAMARFDDPTG